jgi:putative membrane protein
VNVECGGHAAALLFDRAAAWPPHSRAVLEFDALDLSQALPAINASLNALSGVLITIAYVFIRRRNIPMHRRFMLGACYSSLLFLAGYVTNHFLRHGIVTRFTATGWVRPLYFTILITHTVLAIVIVPLVLVTLRNGLKMRVQRHRAIARWTFPLWLYVSITGVVVYLFLYQWYRPA